MKRSHLTSLAAALSILAGSSAWAGPDSKRVIVTFKPGASAQARAKALADLNAKSVSSIVSAGETPDRFVAEVAELSGAAARLSVMDLTGFSSGLKAQGDAAGSDAVLSVEEDIRIKWIEAAPVAFQTTPFPNGTLGAFGLRKFALTHKAAAVRPEITWGIRRVGAPAAWDYTEGAKVRVAVIDTGIASNHPDLQGRVVGGYSAIADSEAEDSYKDDHGHGTHVAGTIGAARNGAGVVGVAPRAQLYAVKVLDGSGSGSLSDVVKGLIWCANNDIDVANMSLGSPAPSEAMHRALRYAKARGVVVVAAAGNAMGGPVGYPGAYPEAIAVAASDEDDNIADFSSRGPEVDFIAPGKDILSAKCDSKGGNCAIKPMSGTSMAAPHVAGLAALAVSQGWSGLGGPDGVLAQLKKAARPLEGLEPAAQGHGLIDAGKLTR